MMYLSKPLKIKNMFFVKLLPLLSSLNLSFDLKPKDDNKIRLIIKFKLEDEKSEQINLTPLVIEASPEELDNELIDELVSHLSVSVPSISNQIKVLTSNLKKVLDSKTAAATSKSKTTSKKVEKPKQEAPTLDFESKPELVEKPKPRAKKVIEKPKPKIEDKKEELVLSEKEEEKIDRIELEKEEAVDLFSNELDDKEAVDLFSDELDNEENPFA